MTYKKQIKELKNQGQYRFLKDIEHLDGNYILYKGKKLLNIASNDYLGISTKKDLFNEFILQINQKDYKFSSSSSRLLSGNNSIYTKLEKLISKIYNKEESVVFNSGYHANTGILPAITTKHDLIIADKLVHASLIDGFKLSNANFTRFKHKDYNQLENILKKEQNNYQNIFIVSESTFSMDGDNADLQILVDLKKQYNALLYIDEAHSIGVYGRNGYGLCEETNLIKDIDFIIGTFGKALASVGAFVALSKEFKEIIVNKSRSLIYTTALPPINLQWTYFILNKLPELSAEREKLISLNKEVIQLFKNNGININAERHIVPIITESNENTIKTYNQLLEAGYFVSAVRYPTVPINTARIRLSLNSNLNINELKDLAFIFNNK